MKTVTVETNILALTIFAQTKYKHYDY